MAGSTENVFSLRRLEGQSFVVSDAAAATAAALDLLAKEGFTEQDATAANAALAASGSAWRLRYAVIGHTALSWLFGPLNEVLPFITGFRQVIPKTFVAVASDGHRFGVAPVVSEAAEPSSGNAAAARVDRVLDALANWPDGPILEVGDRFRSYPDQSSPLHERTFRRLIG